MKCDNCGEEKSATNMARHKKSCLVKHREKVLREIVCTKMTEVFNEMVKCKEPLYHVMVLNKDAEKFKDIVIPFNDMDCKCNHSDKNHCHYIGTYSKRRRNISHEARKADVTVRGYQAKLLTNDQHIMAALGYIQTKELIKDDHYHEDHSDELHTFKNVYQRNLWYKSITKDNPHIKDIYKKYVEKKEKIKEQKRLYFENKRKQSDISGGESSYKRDIKRAKLLDELDRKPEKLNPLEGLNFIEAFKSARDYPSVYETEYEVLQDEDDNQGASEEDDD